MTEREKGSREKAEERQRWDTRENIHTQISTVCVPLSLSKSSMVIHLLKINFPTWKWQDKQLKCQLGEKKKVMRKQEKERKR